MSRIGKKPIDIPKGVSVSSELGKVLVKGPGGELSFDLPFPIVVKVEGSRVHVSRGDEQRTSMGLHGLVRQIISNAIMGVTSGFKKELGIEGVGFKASLQGRKLVLSLGFSHEIEFLVPEDVKVAVEGNTGIAVSGPDKQRVGDVAARIRAFCPPEPYKGKGIRYRGEAVRRKVGKTVA